MSQRLFRVCDRGHCECEASDEVAEVQDSEALEDSPAEPTDSGVMVKAMEGEKGLVDSLNILHVT